MDEVARGIIEARNKFETDIPMVFRLSGTNQKEGLEILREAGLDAYDDMEKAIKHAVDVSKK